MAIAILSLLGGLAAVMPFGAWVVSVLVPWMLLFRLSGALQIMSLYDWRMTPATSLQDYAERIWARFSGVALPARGLQSGVWVRAWML